MLKNNVYLDLHDFFVSKGFEHNSGIFLRSQGPKFSPIHNVI